MPFIYERTQLVLYGRLLYENHFVAGTDGNLSVRLSDGNILITPSGVAKGFISDTDLVIIDSTGKQIADSTLRKASSEYLMHLFVYSKREDINACCHAHPPYATAFSITGRALPSNILPETILSVGDIPLTDYAPPGTDAVPQVLEKYIEHCQAFILRNHGVLTIGRSTEEAYNRMEIVEHYARIIYIAEHTGKLNTLDDTEVRRLEKLRESFGIRN